jgi:hypothetical protein
MSADAATLQTQAEEAREAHALAFRLAFAAAVGLTLGEVLGWDFPFLPAMLAVQLLTSPGGISVKQGLGFVAVMVAASPSQCWSLRFLSIARSSCCSPSLW